MTLSNSAQRIEAVKEQPVNERPIKEFDKTAPIAPQKQPRTYRQRTVEDYLDLMDAEQRASFSSAQMDTIRMLLASAIPKPSPKIVDLRAEVDLLISRFYIVVFVGKDRRQKRRSPLPPLITRMSNVAIATLLLIGINLLISLCLFIFLYLVKSALSIDLIQGAHLSDQINRFR